MDSNGSRISRPNGQRLGALRKDPAQIQHEVAAMMPKLKKAVAAAEAKYADAKVEFERAKQTVDEARTALYTPGVVAEALAARADAGEPTIVLSQLALCTVDEVAVQVPEAPAVTYRSIRAGTLAAFRIANRLVVTAEEAARYIAQRKARRARHAAGRKAGRARMEAS